MLARKTPLRRTPFKRGKPKPERLALPVVPKATGRMRVAKGPARDGAHLRRVAGCTCLVCGDFPVQVHHVRCIGPRALGKRVSDHLTTPLCPWHHQLDSIASAHGQIGEAAFWELYGIDPRDFIRSFSPEGARALEEVNNG